MANGYSTSVSGMGITQTAVIPQSNTSNSNVMTGGVMPRTNGNSTSVSGMGITQTSVIPQGNMNVIRVNENTPNLQLIQSFPVVSRSGNVHIHQDPVTGQMYEMTDEFHSMIPQILARNSGVMTGGVMPSTNGITSKIIPSIYDMTVTIPTENGIENVFSSQIYFENDIEKNLVNNNSFSTQVSSLYNDIEFEKRKKIRDSYMIDLSKRLSKLKSVIITDQTSTQDIISQFPNQFVQNKIGFTYPSITNTDNFERNTMINTINDIRFVYPSLK